MIAAILAFVLAGGPYTYFLPLQSGDPPMKRGVGTPYNDVDHVAQLGVGWYYNWQSCPAITDAAQPFAMIWGETFEMPRLGPEIYAVMGWNEPDLAQQANRSPRAGAEQWRRMELAYLHTRLIFHAASHVGREWIVAAYNEYLALYGQKPRIDELAVHCYFPTADQCIEHVQWHMDLARQWGVSKVRITEFAILPCACTSTGVRGAGSFERARTEADRLVRWFEAEPMVSGYAWFASEFHGWETWAFRPQPACDTALFRDNTLTAWGRWYAALGQH